MEQREYYWYSKPNNLYGVLICMPSIDAYRQRERARCKKMQNHVRCFLLRRSELCKIRRSNNKQEPFLDGRIVRHSALIEIFFLLLNVLLFHIEITRISPHDEGLQKCSIMVPRSHNLTSLDLRIFEMSIGISRPDTGILVPTLSLRQCCKMYLW